MAEIRRRRFLSSAALALPASRLRRDREMRSTLFMISSLDLFWIFAWHCRLAPATCIGANSTQTFQCRGISMQGEVWFFSAEPHRPIG